MPRPATPPPRRALRAFLPWWLALTFAIKAAVLAQLHDLPLLQPVGTSDGAYYLRLAQRVASGDLLLGHEPFAVAPLYAYVLGLLLKLGGGSLWLPAVVQIGLGTLAVGLVHASARRWAGAHAAAAAAIAMTLCGPFTFDEVRVQHGALDPFLTALALWAWARALTFGATCGQPSTRTGPARDWLLAGVTLGLLTLSRPNALLPALGLPIVLLFAWGPRRGWRPATLAVAGVLVMVAPVSARNWLASGEAVLIASHGGLNLYIGNNPEADGSYHHVPGIEPTIAGQVVDARRVAEAALGRHLTASEVSNWFAGRALAFWHAQPARAAALFARKLAYLGNQVELPLDAAYSFYARDLPGPLSWLPLDAGWLVPLGLLGLCGRLWQRQARPARRALAVWAAFVPLYALSVAAFFVAARYRLPWLVPLCVGTGLAVERLLGLARRPGARLELGISLAMVALLAWGTHHDLGLDDGRAEERNRHVELLVDSGQLEAAEHALRRFEPDHPRPAELWGRAGRARLERGQAQAAGAADWLAHASSLAPRDVGLHLALVRALGQAGQEAQARAHVQGLTSVTIASPGDAASALALGELALRWQQPGPADGLLRAALSVEGPHVARTHECLGLTLAFQERALEALVELERACTLDAHSASAQLNRAVVLAQLGRSAEAQAAARTALRLQPDYPQARGLLAALDPRAP